MTIIFKDLNNVYSEIASGNDGEICSVNCCEKQGIEKCSHIRRYVGTAPLEWVLSGISQAIQVIKLAAKYV